MCTKKLGVMGWLWELRYIPWLKKSSAMETLRWRIVLFAVLVLASKVAYLLAVEAVDGIPGLGEFPILWFAVVSLFFLVVVFARLISGTILAFGERVGWNWASRVSGVIQNQHLILRLYRP